VAAVLTRFLRGKARRTPAEIPDLMDALNLDAIV